MATQSWVDSLKVMRNETREAIAGQRWVTACI